MDEYYWFSPTALVLIKMDIILYRYHPHYRDCGIQVAEPTIETYMA